MSRRSTLSRSSSRSRRAARSRDCALQTLRHRVLGILRDLAVGLVLVAAVSYLPGSLTQRWSSQAQRAVAIAHDIRVLTCDVVWDRVTATGSLLVDLAAVLVSAFPSLPAFPVPAPSPGDQSHVSRGHPDVPRL